MSVLYEIEKRIYERCQKYEKEYDYLHLNDEHENALIYAGKILGLVEASKIVKELLKGNNWIPVEERLPEDDKYILLSFENFSIPLVGRYDRDETGAAFYVGDDTESCSSSGVFVNAWMPLPEPYRISHSQNDE